MKRLEEVFEKCFKIPIPKELYPSDEMIPDLRKTRDGVLIYSKNARKNILGAVEHVKYHSQTSDGNVYICGFGGHGINSNGFLYCRIDQDRKVGFRLPYGNVYMDNEKLAHDIPRFLLDYINFEKTVLPYAADFTACESMMSRGYYKIEMLDGRVFNRNAPIFPNVTFKGSFPFLLRLLRDYY